MVDVHTLFTTMIGLIDAGFDSVEKLKSASLDDMMAVSTSELDCCLYIIEELKI